MVAFNKLICAAALAFAAPALAQDSDVVTRIELEGRYAAMKAAMANRDAVAIKSLLADGFVSVDADGKSQNAAAMIKEVLALPPNPNRQSKTTLLSVQSDGSKASVEQRYEMTATTTASNGREKQVELNTVSSDTWIKDRGTWRILRTVTEQLDYSVNGQPVAHKENLGAN